MLRRALLAGVLCAVGAAGLKETASQKRARCIACQGIATALRLEIDDAVDAAARKGVKYGLSSAVSEALDSSKVCADRKSGWWTELSEKYEADVDELVLACEGLMPVLEDGMEDWLQDRSMDAAALRKAACTKKRGKAKPCSEVWAADQTPDQLMTKKQKESAANRELAEAFFANNSKAEGVTTRKSGLQYRVLRKGGGKVKPSSSDEVTCHYRGTLLDGKEFDSSYSRGEPTSFQVGGVIRGWTEALQQMVRGDKWMLWIPSYMAYGSEGAGAGIGADAALQFEVELIGIKGVDEAPKEGECSVDRAGEFLPDAAGRPACVEDPASPRPDDWDNDEDGEWQPKMITNPDYDGIWPPSLPAGKDEL